MHHAKINLFNQIKQKGMETSFMMEEIYKLNKKTYK